MTASTSTSRSYLREAEGQNPMLAREVQGIREARDSYLARAEAAEIENERLGALIASHG